MDPVRVEGLVFNKSTKNTHRYDHPDDSVAVPAIYIRQSGLPSPPPQVIDITISEQPSID